MSVHFWEFYSLGEPQLRGYVCKDGLMAEITTLDLQWQGDAQFNHTAFQADIVDEAGRRTRVDAKVFGVYPLVPDPDFVLTEGDRQSVVEGNSVLVSGDLGGRRIIKQKKTTHRDPTT